MICRAVHILCSYIDMSKVNKGVSKCSPETEGEANRTIQRGHLKLSTKRRIARRNTTSVQVIKDFGDVE